MAILAVAGQPCVDGVGYSGTVADFIVDCIHRLAHPKKVIWALHDRSPIPPYYIDTTALEIAVVERTESQVLSLEPGIIQVVLNPSRVAHIADVLV